MMMADRTISLIPRSTLQGVLPFAGVLLAAPLVGLFVVFGGLRGVVAFLAVAFVASWVVLAGRWWWVLQPVAFVLGGAIYAGFRIHLHEVTLLLCGAALLPIVAMREVAVRQVRPPLPRTVYVLLLYLAVHWAFSAGASLLDGSGGIGNISRVYMHAIWALIFVVALYRYGSTQVLRPLFWILYAAALFRVMTGLVGYYSPDSLEAPATGYALAVSDAGPGDLRISALWLVALSACSVMLNRRRLVAGLHAAIALAGLWLVVLSGGRVSLGTVLVLPSLIAVVYRRYLSLAVVGGVTVGLIVFLNSNPQMLYRLPENARRAVSILVFDEGAHDVHEIVELSNEWHRQLGELGRERWLWSAGAVLFGNRVHGFHPGFLDFDSPMEFRARVAAQMGSYESGLLTILGVTGMAGLLLYTVVFWKLLRPVVPALWRVRLRDYPEAFYFLSVYGIATWVLFSWIAGHFPSQELMMAAIARAAYEDRRRRAETPAAGRHERFGTGW